MFHLAHRKMHRMVLPCLFILITTGCGQADQTSTGTQATIPAQPQTPGLTPRQSQMWARSCALCHVDGTAGAPRINNTEEWAPRLVQGRDGLLAHTVEGFNDMPPLGYCMACEGHDFVAMIEFMAGTTLPEDQP